MPHDEQAKSPQSAEGNPGEATGESTPLSGRSWVKLVRVGEDLEKAKAQAAAAGAGARTLGTAKGEFTVPEDFDAPLPESVLEEFEQ